jgi:hypothetical protein
MHKEFVTPGETMNGNFYYVLRQLIPGTWTITQTSLLSFCLQHCESIEEMQIKQQHDEDADTRTLRRNTTWYFFAAYVGC